MKKQQIHAKIIEIQNTLGISNNKMGELMGVTMQTYASCKSDKAGKNSFNIGNLKRLKSELGKRVDDLTSNNLNH